LSTGGDEHHERNAMLIVQQKSRRDFMRLGAGSLLSAAAFATLPVVAASATQSSDASMQTHRGERGRFKSVDEALVQGVSDGTIAGVVALAAPVRRLILWRIVDALLRARVQVGHIRRQRFIGSRSAHLDEDDRGLTE
jgi:hypothetical protein